MQLISDQLWDDIWKMLAISAVLTVFVGGASIIYKSVSASGNIEYCTVVYSASPDEPPVYKLYGVREWRSDTKLGVYFNSAEALAQASALKCPILKKDAKPE